MPNRRRIWQLLGAGHLVVVVCGAAYLLPDRDSGLAAQLFRWYASMSGAESSYGFFAPAVGAKHSARFFLSDAQGATWQDTLLHTASTEARLRLSGIVEQPFMSGQTAEFPEWRKRLVTSWAATMFSRHPSAVALSVKVEYYDIPPITEYRAGSRPNWEKVYEAEFRRQPPAAEPRTDQ